MSDFMSDPPNMLKCPKCGEEVEKEWRFCPACEHPLNSPLCPECSKPVKEHWVRCPFCEAALLCPSCKARLSSDGAGCPSCGTASSGKLPERIVEPVVGMEFVLAKAGSFSMGDRFQVGIENETPVHHVELDRFHIAKYPVTQSQWDRLMPENPSMFPGENRPVERVSFRQALEFARKMAQANNGRYDFGLPTEAQWEYAATSCGAKDKYAGGDEPETVAWFEENSGSATRPAGKKKPNSLGLYDMSGNVWEWCLDFYKEDAYRFHEDRNPQCREQGPDRVIRGGGWNTDAWSVRCARRFGFPEEDCGPSLGFRLVIL